MASAGSARQTHMVPCSERLALIALGRDVGRRGLVGETETAPGDGHSYDWTCMGLVMTARRIGFCWATAAISVWLWRGGGWGGGINQVGLVFHDST